MQKKRNTTITDNNMSNARAIAHKCLVRWAKGGVFAETLIARESVALSASDRALVQAIVLGTLRNMRYLEHLCHELRSGKLEDSARWLVLVGLCQLFIIGQAEHAAVNETVSIAPARLRGLVNGMLRNAVRRRCDFENATQTLPLGVRYSAPDWLVKRWVAEFGSEETEKMLEWNTHPAPVYVRLNPLREFAVPSDWIPLEQASGWYRVPAGLPMQALADGAVYVADPSTRYCIEMLQPQPGEKVLDACAAPGGKSVAMIGATRGNIELLATDAAPHRLEQLRKNLLNAGALNVQVACHDWFSPCPQNMLAQFDAVLLDVPCSNSGVLQRRVDARWRLEPAEFDRLASLQSAILHSASQAVRSGGRLVYSTCSIDSQEDRKVVDAFLASHPEFSLVRDYLALPHREQADGAYAALLLRS